MEIFRVEMTACNSIGNVFPWGTESQPCGDSPHAEEQVKKRVLNPCDRKLGFSGAVALSPALTSAPLQGREGGSVSLTQNLMSGSFPQNRCIPSFGCFQESRR